MQLIVDFDISCSIPEVPESIIEGHDWFLSAVTLGRIQSLAYEMLFSVKASSNTIDQIYTAVRRVYAGLEHWRLSLPIMFHPSESTELYSVSPILGRILLYQHFCYHSVLMAISRLSIHIGEPNLLSAEGIGRVSLIRAARQVLELIRFTVPKVYSSLL
jgi:hypothetical protein